MAMCSRTPPLVLLRLFPSLLHAKCRALLPAELFGERLPPAIEPTGDAYRSAVAVLLPYLMSHRCILCVCVCVCVRVFRVVSVCVCVFVYVCGL